MEVDAMKVYKGCGSVNPLFLNLGTRLGGGSGQPYTPAALALGRKAPDTHFVRGWSEPQSRSGHFGGKSLSYAGNQTTIPRTSIP